MADSGWPDPHGAAGPWMQGSGDHLLPYWLDKDESAEHCPIMLEIHTTCCPDFRRGYCTRGKGKVGHCFCYHFESQARRPPVDPTDGRIRYWDVQCPNYNSEMGYCPNGEVCSFAHGRNEVSYHPAKYKTRLCNGTECRGEAVCCFAHSEEDLRPGANERYSYLSLVSIGGNAASAGAGDAAAQGPGASSSFPGAGFGAAPASQKHRFCASYPNVSQCRRGAACTFAHSRDEACTPLLSVEEEEHQPEALTHPFFTEKFKTLWCPIGAQHDWQNCPYAHTYQDARRTPGIGYGPQPCPYWSKKDTRVAYSQRCPLGLRCPYSHGAKEQLYHPKYFKTVICRDLQLKGCPRQTLCAFFHRRTERHVADADNVDYMQPLDKDNISSEWSSYFLTPPFFQEAANDGGGATGSSMGGGGGGGPGGGMSHGGGKGKKGQEFWAGDQFQQGYGGMSQMHMKGGAMGGPMGGPMGWYNGYMAGMTDIAGMQGGGPGMMGSRHGRMPMRKGGDGGSRTPDTAESDAGLEEDGVERDQELMQMQMMDPNGWGQPSGFPPGAQPVWGGPMFYGVPGGFVPAPYGASPYPCYFPDGRGQDQW